MTIRELTVVSINYDYDIHLLEELAKLMTNVSLRQDLGKTVITQNELERFKKEMEM